MLWFLIVRFTTYPGVRRFPRGIAKVSQATEHEDILRQVVVIDYLHLKNCRKLNWIIEVDILFVEILRWVSMDDITANSAVSQNDLH
jgi:hypothetical protein